MYWGWCTIREAALQMGMSSGQVRDLAAAGQIETIMIHAPNGIAWTAVLVPKERFGQ